VAFDLKTFFTVAGKDPVEVTAADVFDFLAHQRGDRTVVRPTDRESGLSARTIARRLSPVPGLYACLVARGDTPVRASPVLRGLLTRRQGGTMRSRMAPLVRVPRTLPRVLSAEEAGRLAGALRAHRDRAMVLGMLLAGLRRCEVPGLRLADVQVAGRRLVVARARAAITGWCRPRTGTPLQGCAHGRDHLVCESFGLFTGAGSGEVEAEAGEPDPGEGEQLLCYRGRRPGDQGWFPGDAVADMGLHVKGAGDAGRVAACFACGREHALAHGLVVAERAVPVGGYPAIGELPGQP
jgi:hypothetical protein